MTKANTKKSKATTEEIVAAPVATKTIVYAEPRAAEPSLAHESVASTRRNRAATIVRTDEYANIRNAPYPFSSRSRGHTDSNIISAAETIELAQRAYFNFPVLRNVIDVMTEFSVGRIHWRGGNAKSRQFFEAYSSKIKLWPLQDQYYREYYRSGNVFLYKFMASMDAQNAREISRTFSIEARKNDTITIPTRYIILNPVDIEARGASNFTKGTYYKILNEYELSRLKNPQTDEDKELFNSLPKEARKTITLGRGAALQIRIPLEPEYLTAVFYKKQDYEPFGVPMAWPVLRDLSAKDEMKQIDMAISRVTQQAILLITMGTKPDDGGVNPEHLESVKKLMENQSVGRVLVADYTTDAKFVIPEISSILNSAKYEILESDINIGLNNIFVGGEKFANQSAKVEVFIERLKHGREGFLQHFLIPEVKKIAKEMGFNSWPTPVYEEYDIKNDGTSAKLYVRLAELGILTPDETYKAIKTNQLPEADTQDESQQAYTNKRDKGLYKPLMGTPKGQDAGRPSGTNAPKKTNVRPIKGLGGESYSSSALMKNFVKAEALQVLVEKEYKKSNKLRKVTPSDEYIIEQISRTIIANEEPAKWEESVAEYLNNPQDKNPERIAKINEIGANHSIDFFMASILLASENKK